MTCQHATPLSPQVNSCGLNRYGGRPSAGVCRGCIERGENRSDFVHQPEQSIHPQFLEQINSALIAVGRFAVSGFVIATYDVIEQRKDICRECPEWDSEALNKTGRCRKCGCSTWAKLRMATERCPIGKWESCVPEKSKE